MKEMRVQEWMRTDVIAINPELRVERVWELMERERVRHLPVVKNGILVGIITERDLKRAIFPTLPAFPVRQEGKPQPSGAPGDLPAEAIMTKGVYTAKPTDPLLSPALRMLNEKIGALPVVDDTGKLVGIVTETDLLKALVFLLQKASLF
ncbi:MAG: CBS domain-containing protein [Deltaproteobacteria bacterium]|nr:CBS domain-containing protein [Deltaproteobacteria bacterium]